MIHHVVLFRFHDTASPLQVEDARRALLALRGAVREIRGLTFGPNVGPTADEWPWVLIVAVDDVAAVERYLAHPVHVDTVAKYVTPVVAARFAVDAEAP